MAYVSGGYKLTCTFTDNGGNAVERTYIMDNTVTTEAAAITAAGALITDIFAFTDAAMPQYSIGKWYYDDAYALPASGVQVEDQASMTILLEGVGNQKANLNIPAPDPDTFVSSSGPQANVLNTTDPIVTNFVDNFLAAGKFTLSDGQKASRILSGKRVHRKSSKG